jgi:putative FmdB family regulatory protein
MPIYEYRCRGCETTFDALVRGDGGVTCPHCGSPSLNRLISVPFASSVHTARRAGHTCCGREERDDTPPYSEGDVCRRG